MSGLVYLQPMRFPSEATHTIQIARTIAALGRRVEVVLVVAELTVDPAALTEAIERAYGVAFGSGVRVVAIPRAHFRGPRLPLTLRALLRGAPAGTALYTRSLRMASRLTRWRWLHGRRVFLESHKKAGYLREDPVPGSRYEGIRRRFERGNESLAMIRRVYAEVDCVFFLHRHALEAVRQTQPLRDGDHLWYGVRPGIAAGGADRRGLAHCGSLAEHKLIDLLLDALDRAQTPLRVTLYGGTPDRIEAVARGAAGRPCSARIELPGWLPHPALHQALQRHTHGVALQEGMKVVDYLEAGLTPIVPEIPSYREVLDERHAIFFRPDDPSSLAAALDGAQGRRADPRAVAELAERYAVDRRADAIVSRL
ncbi:MAG: glycosyltransferase [Gemmatimonadales bacterium]